MRGKIIDGFPSRAQALKDFFAAWEPHTQKELVPLEQATGRVTAEAVYSSNTLPVFRSSGCDGIAVSSAAFSAGMPDYTGWRMGTEFVRADTGDDFPDAYDAVIAIEEVDLTEEGGISYISPDVAVEAGSNVNPKGSTLQQGDLLIEQNMPVRPCDLAALAMGGAAMVPVWKKPKVAFLPTGSELVPSTTIPKRGENVDTNSLLVGQTLRELGAEPVVFPITPDTPELLAQRLRQALDTADIVIMNAGTALGSEDFNFGLIGRQGKMIHHYIAAAPGRPMGLAVLDGKPVISLPGPTMAAFFGLEWCISTVVARWLHVPARQRPRIKGVLMEDIRCTDKMAILIRLDAHKTPDGTYQLYPRSFRKGSAAASIGSNALYVSDVGESGRSRGEILEAELLRSPEFIGTGSGEDIAH